MKFRENVSLARYSHLKIGGPARFFFEAKTERDIVEALAEAKRRRLPIFVLAGGTNLLIDDKGFAGLTLRPMVSGIRRLRGVRPSSAPGEVLVEAGAGVAMADLVRFASTHGFAGLAWAGGLPGTVGGAVRGNAGCFGGEMKDAIVSVRSVDVRTRAGVTRTAKECRFGYRDSVFKKKERRKGGGEIITGVTFRLVKGDRSAIARAVREKIAYRAAHQPLDYPNIGSIFKNVPLETLYPKTSANYRVAIAAGELTVRGVRCGVKTDPFPVIAAARLIAESGLRGVSIGGAMVSVKHPNFIVNALGADAWDIAVLIRLVKEVIWRRFGVRLEEEVQVVYNEGI